MNNEEILIEKLTKEQTDFWIKDYAKVYKNNPNLNDVDKVILNCAYRTLSRLQQDIINNEELGYGYIEDKVHYAFECVFSVLFNKFKNKTINDIVKEDSEMYKKLVNIFNADE